MDGLIYADLAKAGSGSWGDHTPTDYYSWAALSASSLKTYAVSEEEYGGFGDISNPMVSVAKSNSNPSGMDRFYVMALSDVTTSTYSTFYWYKTAWRKDALENYHDQSYNDFGEGKEFTKYDFEKWDGSEYGAQQNQDMWKALKEYGPDSDYPFVDKDGKYAGPWFVPSRAEWCAFADFMRDSYGSLKANYDSYGLQEGYWSSAQSNVRGAFLAAFRNGYIFGCSADSEYRGTP